jgi:hypothetical protein
MIETAYAAGFFDGEGYVGIQMRVGTRCAGPVYQMRVAAYQDDPRPLRAIAERWGGPVRVRKTPRLRRIAYRWLATGPTAAGFLRDVLPFLIVKKEQAMVALEFQASRRNPGRAGLTPEHRAQCLVFRNQIMGLNNMQTQHPDYAVAND